MIPTRQKAGILFILVLVTFLGSSGLMLNFQRPFLYLVFSVPILFAVLLGRLRCERCEKLVYRNKVKMGGVAISYYGGLNPFPKKCGECGFDLTRSARVITDK